MSRIVAVILTSPDGPDAAPFRAALAAESDLSPRVELRFLDPDTPPAEAAPQLADAEIACAPNRPAPLLALAPRLRWVAFWGAGLDRSLTPDLLARGLLVTNASGVHGPNIAEHVLAFMLMFSRRMPLHLRDQLRHQWAHHTSYAEGPGELSGQTLGILGLGRIGEALAARAKAFGMRVLATKRDVGTRHGAGTDVDALYPPDQLDALLRASDHVCVCLPYTPQTHHLLDARRLAEVRPTAYLYNIARGRIIDEAALVDALRAGRIAGAGLDVFETEPLPADSPLWDLENVLITPHVAGLTPHYFTRFAALFVDNLRRFLSGQPLRNLYDPARGY